MKSSASESISKACFNLEWLSRSLRLDRPGNLALERLYEKRREEKTPRRSPNTRMQLSLIFFL